MAYRTLILEDDDDIRRIMAMFLTKRGHQVLSFDSPLHCPTLNWSGCSSQKGACCFDFLISDQMMPGMTGLEFLELLDQQGCPLDNKHKALITGSDIDPEQAARLNCQVFAKPINWSGFCRWLSEGEADLGAGFALAH